MSVHSVLSCHPSDTPILQCFRSQLCDVYDVWEPISANSIVISAIDFINGCLMENDEAIRNVRLTPDAQSWPYYLREKTGLAAAYSFFIFPRDRAYNVAHFINVMGDIMVFINLSNDILSFYKEEKDDEVNNYIYNRAHVSGKSVLDTLKDVTRDAVAAYNRVCRALKSQSPASYERWKLFVLGYMYVPVVLLTSL
ncbi:hypothetical protein H0H93_011130 [Arthromyces matolae]|nr:hypothetical protein H0H93_011130 [Arthromyces matolae]